MANAKKKKTKTAPAAASKNTKAAVKNAVKSTTDSAAKTADASLKAAENTVKETSQATNKVLPKLSTIDSKVATSDQVVNVGTNVMKDFIASSAQEAQKAQEKAFSLGNENMQTFTQTAGKASNSLTEAFSASKEQINAVVESSKIASELGRDLQEQLVSECNEAFNENIALSKDMLACRTLNDLAEIQNRAMQNNVSRFFEQSARITDAWLKLSTTAAEPLNSQAEQASERIKKPFAA